MRPQLLVCMLMDTAVASHGIPFPGGAPIGVVIRDGKFGAAGSFAAHLSNGSCYVVQTVPSGTRLDSLDLMFTSLVFDALPETDYTFDEQLALERHLDRGGRLVLLGERSACCAAQNTRIHSLTAALHVATTVLPRFNDLLVAPYRISHVDAMSGVTAITHNKWAALLVDDTIADVLASSTSGDVWGADLYVRNGRVRDARGFEPVASVSATCIGNPRTCIHSIHTRTCTWVNAHGVHQSHYRSMGL